ncbi:hypothetical protein P8452_07463 [Trifolium repens]|nr:hypothetical protein P8452_07463 [Trifolium repens]
MVPTNRNFFFRPKKPKQKGMQLRTAASRRTAKITAQIEASPFQNKNTGFSRYIVLSYDSMAGVFAIRSGHKIIHTKVDNLQIVRFVVVVAFGGLHAADQFAAAREVVLIPDASSAPHQTKSTSRKS